MLPRFYFFCLWKFNINNWMMHYWQDMSQHKTIPIKHTRQEHWNMTSRGWTSVPTNWSLTPLSTSYVYESKTVGIVKGHHLQHPSPSSLKDETFPEAKAKISQPMRDDINWLDKHEKRYPLEVKWKESREEREHY